MPYIYYTVPTWVGGSVTAAIFVLFAVLGVEVVYKVHPTEFRKDYNDIVGFIIAVIGVLYAVLLASVAIMAMEGFEKAQTCVTREASCIGDIQRSSYGLHPATSRAVRLAAIAYGNAVVDQEWADMKKGIVPTEAWAKLKALQDVIFSFEPVSMKEQNVQMQMITKLTELADVRRERMHLAEDGIEPTVWLVILVGNFGMIAFTFFFGLHKLWHQMLSAGLAALAALVIVLVAAMDRPYWGDLSVSPEMIKSSVARIDRS